MSRLIAISDIHGCFMPFYNLVVKEIDLRKSDHLVLLGDYIDRGYNSREVVDYIIDLGKMGFNVTPLTGNHEQLLLEAHRNPEMLPLWLMNSGDTTLNSFGIKDIRDIEQSYLSFFKGLKFYAEEGNNLFVHAGFNDYAEDPYSEIFEMIWECRPVYENPLFKDKTIVHGHRPKTIQYVKKLLSEKSRVIPIDTGCVYDKELGYGNLSALDVTRMTLISVPNV
jgi:serine/threonine protein phosphatase 1